MKNAKYLAFQAMKLKKNMKNCMNLKKLQKHEKKDVLLNNNDKSDSQKPSRSNATLLVARCNQNILQFW